MKAIRCDEMTWLAFGHVQWGSTVPPFAVLAGTLIRAEVIEPLPDGHRVKWFVSSPLYAEGPGDQRVIYYVHDDRMAEGSADADVWDAWLGGYQPDDGAVPVKVAVSEGLQAPTKEPYRSQRTDTTTTPLRKALAMTAKTTPAKTDTTPAPEVAPAPTTDRAKSTVSQDGTATCAGCQTDLPVTRFPTVRNAEGGYERALAECRSCRDARRVAKRKASAA